MSSVPLVIWERPEKGETMPKIKSRKNVDRKRQAKNRAKIREFLKAAPGDTKKLARAKS